MRAEAAADVALGLYVLGLVMTFGLRTWAHRRATGSSGFRGPSGGPGTASWWGGLLFAAALVLTPVGLVLAVTGTARSADVPAALRWTGLVVAVTGFAIVLMAQSGMGTSWRIGVAATERTALVIGGLFALTRNPVFTGMSLALGGLVVMTPTVLTLAGLACLVLAVELQVRVVEEPYLLATHGDAYATYAARVGRFIPRTGRFPSAWAADS